MKRALFLIVLVGCKASAPEEAAVKPVVSVKVAKAVIGEIDEKVVAPASIFPREKANITSSLTAPIRALRAHKGDHVSKGQVLAQLENRDLLAQRVETAAAVHAAQVLRDRRQQLFAQGAIPERDLLVTRSELAQAQARLDRIEAQLHFTELRSPFAGSVTEQFLYPGDMVKPDTPVFTVVDMTVAVARAQVPENEVAPLKRGLAVSFSSDAIGDEPMPGKVVMINQAVDPTRRTVEVWAELPNAEGRLRDGVFGHVTVVTGRQPRRVLVPKEALLGSEQAVMVVDTKNIAHKRAVHVLGRSGNQVAVDGLNAGDTVVVEAGYGLPEGTTVKVDQGDKDDQGEKEEKGTGAKGEEAEKGAEASR